MKRDAYRLGWRLAISIHRRMMRGGGYGERDAHIDHDWQSAVITTTRREHRRAALRERTVEHRAAKLYRPDVPR